MKMENQVCSLEQAKRLNELGIVQISQFYWRQGQLQHIDSVNSWGDQETLKDMIKYYDARCEPGTSWRDAFHLYSAFTVAELGVMLPARIDICSLVQRPIPFTNNSGSAISYGIQYRYKCGSIHDQVLPATITFGETEAQARAKLLIRLLEDKIISADEVNQRLQAA